jgi:hypothetical protein
MADVNYLAVITIIYPMVLSVLAVSGAQFGGKADGAMSGSNHKLTKFGGLKGQKGGRFGMNIGGMNIGGQMSGGSNGGKGGGGSSSWGGSWKSGGNGGKAGQFGGKGGGGLSSSSSWGSSWKSGGHGGKVDDGISQINGNGGGGGVIMDVDHTTSGTTSKVNDGGGKTNGNFDGGVFNEHGDGDSQNVVGNKGVGYGRYSSAGDANGLGPNHSDGTTGSEDGNGDVGLHGGNEGSVGTSPDENVFHQTGDDNGERNDGSQNVGMNSENSDRTDSKTGTENGEVINNGHQSAGNTGTYIPNVGASVDGDIDGGSRYGKRPSTLGVNSMVSSSEKGINDETSTSNDNGINDGGFQKGSKSGELTGHMGGGNMVGNSQEGSSNEVRLSDDSKTAESGSNDGGMVSKGTSGNSLNNSGGEMTSKTGSGKPLSHTFESEAGLTSTDGVNLDDVGGINYGDAGSRLGAGENMARNSNDDSVQDVATFDHPRGMMNVDDSGNPDRIRPDDETVGRSSNSYPGPPGTWLLGKKNNISRHDDSNNGSLGIRHGNSSGTRGHKVLWKWCKNDNITRHHGIVNDSNVGDSEGTSNQHGIVNGQKKDITVHHGIEGDRRSKTHHERGKKSGSGGHHEKTIWGTKNNMTVHQTKHSHFKKNVTPKEISGAKESLGKPKKSNKPKKIVKQH